MSDYGEKDDFQPNFKAITPKGRSTAVAIKDGNGDKSVPTVKAAARGALADKIIAIAQDHGVLVHEDQQLSQLLSTLELGDDIPKQLYVLIAELIAFSYVLQGKFPENWNNVHNKVDFQA